MKVIRSLKFVRDVQRIDDKMIVRVENPEEQNPDLIKAVIKAGGKIIFLTELRPTLKDIYFEIVKEKG
ncbi:DUF4162 domain-containing protein [Candidatus Bathyarchaeota archaeon]|nr:DUF4162 domain-containing protein [Candidatus Bathyarchaeota archaeon]